MRIRTQRGAALLALVLITVLGLIAFLVSDLVRHNPKRVAERSANEKLGQAREALIGHASRAWCAGTGNQALPYLPCPSGIDGQAPASCPGTAINRLPWSTIGTGPLTDAAGECFWFERGGTTAVVYAPGAAEGGQSRNPAAGGLCSSGSQASFLELGVPTSNDIRLTITESDIPKPTACRPPGGPGVPGNGNPACQAARDVFLSYLVFSPSPGANNCRTTGNNYRQECIDAAAAINNASPACSSQCVNAANAAMSAACRQNFQGASCRNIETDFGGC
ncbi:hypothetical protein [Pseudomarimonas arenosa]|uniref:Tfp pilus assembly protein PilX n=1 Tax=Pseudomarimonas arenosa TaxID=2774145 RepID=A0AAW3ZMY8_9GAMM|nr:hypothetical protein [Pseudomarimonas arenosa]MBD8526004.1 hypothetical protein [Pseudomarimonas arenosa]